MSPLEGHAPLDEAAPWKGTTARNEWTSRGAQDGLNGLVEADEASNIKVIDQVSSVVSNNDASGSAAHPADEPPGSVRSEFADFAC